MSTEKIIAKVSPADSRSTRIIVTRRTKDYHACVEGHTELWESDTFPEITIVRLATRLRLWSLAVVINPPFSSITGVGITWDMSPSGPAWHADDAASPFVPTETPDPGAPSEYPRRVLQRHLEGQTGGTPVAQVLLFQQALMEGGNLPQHEANDILREALGRCPDKVTMLILGKQIEVVYLERGYTPYWKVEPEVLP